MCSKELSDYFTPLDVGQTKTIKVSIEGPNASGKTVASRLVPNAFRAIEASSSNSEYCTPLVKIAEPPTFLVAPNDPRRVDTWRALTKEGISRDGVFTEEELQDPLTVGTLFLLARRFLESQAVNDYPYPKKAGYRYEDPWFGHVHSFGREKGKRTVYSAEEAQNIACQVLLTDRGTLSTLRYQGGNPDGGTEVVRLIKRMYQEKFLLREAMTIVVVPTKGSELAATEDRDEDERDQFKDGSDPIRRYTGLRDLASETMTDNFVVIENDPTGQKNSISVTSLLITLLTKCAVQSKVEGTPLPWSTPNKVQPIRLNFNFYKFYRYMNLADTGFSRDCERFIMQMRDGMFYSGDVGLRFLDNQIELILMQDVANWRQ